MVILLLIPLLFGLYAFRDMIKSRNDLIEISSEGIYVSERDGEVNFRWEELGGNTGNQIRFRCSRGYT